jgi:hypothetical protein
MESYSTVKILYKWNHTSTGLEGRPRIRWKTGINKDLRNMKLRNCTKCRLNGRKYLGRPKL